MKCKDCKFYVPDAPPEMVTKVENIGGGRGRYITRKVYKRCSRRLASYGYMASGKGSHQYCFEPKIKE